MAKRKYTDAELKEYHRKNGKANEKNITAHTFGIIDKEKHREIARKGQKASTESKRRKKDIATICNDLLSLSVAELSADVLNPQLKEIIEKYDLNITLYDLIIAKQAEIALKGSTSAAQFIRDTAGDKPSEKLHATAEIITDSDRALLNNISDRLDSIEAIDTNTTPL